MTGNRNSLKKRKYLVKENNTSLINLPSEIISIIESQLDIKTRNAMTKSCKTFNNFFQPGLYVTEALHYAAFGMKEKLDILLTRRRDLVYKRGSTVDPCGRIVHGTVYRIALGAKDWNPFPDQSFEEMTEMIERHMRTLPNGEEQIELQKAEQFPEGWEERERIREAIDSAAVKTVFAVIDRSNTDEDCKDAIEAFIRYLKSQDEVKLGYHYNDKLLSEAKDLYNYHCYRRFGGPTKRKSRLAAIKIIGNIQGRMTACLAMAHCDGLDRVTEEKKQLSRRTILDDGTPFFSSDLGSTYVVYSYGAGCYSELSLDDRSPQSLQNLCLAKTSYPLTNKVLHLNKRSL